ncbi:hypothetical protein [Novosphingobium sp. M1R2S20]|uniref:Secreted protein n=1 Tax=Novosphingobium rhizovicinum TaxID=3228928 RepID=A0ABV3RF05_9SPHN
MAKRICRLAVCVLVALPALSACKQEPSFEERYASAQKTINSKAAELEKDMASRAAQAAPSEAASDPSGTT